MIKSGWTGVWMNQDDLTGATTSSREDGIAVGTAAYETDDAAADYRFELHPDNVFRMSVTYRMKTAKPTEVEFNNYLNANLFRGKRYSLDTENGARTGMMPVQAQDSSTPAGRMGERITSARFETILGPVVVNVEGSDPACRRFTLYDARSIKVEWAKKNPIFWFGANVSDTARAWPPDHHGDLQVRPPAQTSRRSGVAGRSEDYRQSLDPHTVRSRTSDHPAP